MKKNESQFGQTLIETIVAIFILTTALTAGLAMAISALSSATASESQIIASNLAREGVDIARMMRDSNWLDAGADDAPEACSDIGGKLCYDRAFTTPYNFTLGNNPEDNRFRLVFDPEDNTWILDRRNGQENYLLCLQSDGTYQHTNSGQCNFARRVQISTRTGTSLGYSTTDLDNAEVIVQSIVQWRGKRCPAISNPNIISASPAPCKIVVEERLTNWKDYQ